MTLDLFLDGKQLRDRGIEVAEDHANAVIESWSQQAYRFLVSYCIAHDEFMAEDVRIASEGIVPPPPSDRAWGAIFTRAVKQKIIRRLGYREVKNPKAHCTPATLWTTK